MNRVYPYGTRFSTAEAASLPAALERPEEVLVADTRAGLTPSEMVGLKLSRLLRGGSVSDSHVRFGGLLARGHSSG